jgi:hypothetical protein
MNSLGPSRQILRTLLIGLCLIAQSLIVASALAQEKTLVAEMRSAKTASHVGE